MLNAGRWCRRLNEGEKMFNNFYQGKTILVTGVAGVKGTWLALALQEAGAKVRGVDVRPRIRSRISARAV